jgi:hypothetical protein
MDPTNLAYKPLWFDSCTADTGITLMMVWVGLGGIAGIAYVIALTSSSSLAGGRAKGLMSLCFFWFIICTNLCVMDPFPPQLVRLTLARHQLEVRSCHRWVSYIRRYPLSDVDISSELQRRGSKKVPHYLLALRDTRNKVPIGSIELTGSTHINFPLLRQIAPFAARQYLANRAASFKIRGIQ